MDIFSNAMLYALSQLHELVGNYGLAIVLLTMGIRLLLWPLNTQQTVSMRKMQDLQPKIKALQAKFKDDPMKMQQATMQLYSEQKLNPMAGCLPMLIQFPIFIGLYAALNSPEFLVMSANEHFLGVDRLYHTLYTKAGQPMDGEFQVEPNDRFGSAKQAKLTMKDGDEMVQDIGDTNNIVKTLPSPMIPGRPVTLILNLDALNIKDPATKAFYRDKLKSIQLTLVNNSSRELEKVEFHPYKNQISTLIQTKKAQYPFSIMDPSTWNNISHSLNLDVLVLVLMYGTMTLLYSKVMSPKQAPAASTGSGDTQADMQRMMKFMPLMFVGVMFFIPIPAGVMLYLVVTTAMMFIQTAWINYTLDKEKNTPVGKPSEQVIEVKAK